MGASRARRVKAGALVLGKAGIPVQLSGASAVLGAEVEEGESDAATLAALLTALDDMGLITFVPDEE